MDKHFGFIGVGRMGGPMAGRLLDAGYALTIFDTRPETVEPLARKGARLADSAQAVASATETVFLSLPTPAIVREVSTGKGGIAAGSKVRTLVDLSTTGPRVAEEIATALAAKNITWMDSPVSGGISGAQKGTLAVMVSGPRAIFDALEPALKAIGKPFYIGAKPGMGHTMKLANNLLSATALAATSEAVVMGVKAGLDPRVMIDVINAGSGMTTASRDKFPRAILPRSFDFGFAMELMYKDLKLCMDEAGGVGAPMQIGERVTALFQRALERFGPASDFTNVYKVVETAAGLDAKG